jgi:hypothetical protein
MQGNIDTQEIPERTKFQRLQRDASGKLPRRKSVIHAAVADEMNRLHLTVYRLWKLARVHYPPLSQSAVHEFLKGHRQLELPSIEALLAALHLRVVSGSGGQRGHSRPAAKERNAG